MFLLKNIFPLHNKISLIVAQQCTAIVIFHAIDFMSSFTVSCPTCMLLKVFIELFMVKLRVSYLAWGQALRLFGILYAAHILTLKSCQRTMSG